MKTKTINAILAKKFDAFSASITDESVRKLVEMNTIITGGSIVSLLLNQNVNDYDMYFRNAETVRAVGKYYVDKFKANPPSSFKEAAKDVEIYVREDGMGRIKIVIQSAGIASEEPQKDYQYFEGIQNAAEQADQAQQFVDAATKNVEALDNEPASKLEDKDADGGERYRPVFLSANAITLATKVQLVIRFYGEPEEIHKNYDFVHCTSYWTSWTRQSVLRPDALESIITKELRYIGSRYPICSLIRTRKFLGRGWTINAGQYVKMAWQVSELDLTNIAVLEDQLVGVDAAYFMQVIAMLKKKDAEKIDGTYLMTVIDKLF